MWQYTLDWSGSGYGFDKHGDNLLCSLKHEIALKCWMTINLLKPSGYLMHQPV
jgi:hypothetical protein